MSEQTQFRCAIYTRKSSEEGLDQDFNSIEAQREAGEAYVRSQAHEGWRAIQERFDDGGYSGGNMDRPALARLMTAIEQGQVDIVVIYKIDRLTRSLTDFARLAETFDRHKVSFVSVTQQFNTTNSMGRLMLNVLLSFAQFEREITGERIRDKIAASKKKGMWMGGVAPMGYDVIERRLIVNEAEAEIIREIFRRFLEVRNVPALLDSLKSANIKTALRRSSQGRVTGGRHFTRGHLYKLLSNPIYVGRVRHKALSHRGQHGGIVDGKVWDAVQAQLASNTQGSRTRRRRAIDGQYLLTNILVAADGSRFIPGHANKGTQRYHYYVEEKAAQKVSRRLPAVQIDNAVIQAFRGYLNDDGQLSTDFRADGNSSKVITANAKRCAAALSQSPERENPLRRLLTKVVYRESHLELHIDRAGLASTLGSREIANERPQTNLRVTDDKIVVSAPIDVKRRGSQLKLVVHGGGSANSYPDQSLVTLIVRARDWAGRVIAGATLTQIAEDEKVNSTYVSLLLPFAFLAPTVVEDILAGCQPADMTADRLTWKTPLSPNWHDQLVMFLGRSFPEPGTQQCA